MLFMAVLGTNRLSSFFGDAEVIRTLNGEEVGEEIDSSFTTGYSGRKTSGRGLEVVSSISH